jgi:hypothetical protein
MKRVFSVIALAALLALAIPGAAQAHRYRHHHHHAWGWWCCCCCYYPGWHHHHHWWRGHGWRHHGWGRHYGWYDPHVWGPVHASTDFMADRLNRGQPG